MRLLLRRRPSARKKSLRPVTRHHRKLWVEFLEDRCLPAQLSFVFQPLPVALGTVLNPLDGIQVRSPDGGPVTLALGNNTGAAQLSGTVTQSPDPGTGIATFEDLRLIGGTPGSAYTLLATSPGDDPATSGQFVVAAGPTNLYIATTLPTTKAGDNLGPITVQVLDASGAVSKGDDGDTITLFVDHNASTDPNGAMFLLPNNDRVDHLTAKVADGQAVFGDPTDLTSSPVRLTQAGVGFTLTAEAGNDAVKKSTSNRFVITAGAASKLDFQNPPTLAIVKQTINQGGRTPPFAATGVTVQVEDQFGNPVLDSTATVKISLKDNPAGGTLTGAPPNGVAAVNGLAVFTTLSIDKAGTGYTLQADSTGLDSKVTAAFNVLPGNPTLQFLDAKGNPTTNPLGAGPFPVGSRLPTFYVEADATDGKQTVGADGQQVILGPPGRLFGETTATVAFNTALGKSVALFNNVYIGSGKTGDSVTLQAQFLTLGGTINATPIMLSAGQATKLLFAGGGAIKSAVAGTNLQLKAGGAIQVFIQDNYGNTVTTGPASTAAIWLGVNRAAPNSLTTLIGDQFDPNSTGFGTYIKVNAVAGVATFPKVFINRASTSYQLAVGSPDFNFNTDTSQPFDVTIGAANKLDFLVQPDPAGKGANQRLTGNGNEIMVAVEDQVGNVITSDSGRNITMILATNPDPDTGSHKAALAGQTTLADQNGIAIFDLLYIRKDKNLPTAQPNIPGFQLQANASTLPTPNTPLSNPFLLNRAPGLVGVAFDASGKQIPNAIPLPTFTVNTPPSNVGVNQPLSFSFKLYRRRWRIGYTQGQEAPVIAYSAIQMLARSISATTDAFKE
jgi:hypothetical protein